MKNSFEIINILYNDFLKRSNKDYKKKFYLNHNQDKMEIFLGNDSFDFTYLNVDLDIQIDFFRYLFPKKDIFDYFDYKNHNVTVKSNKFFKSKNLYDLDTSAYKYLNIETNEYYINIDCKKLYQYLIDNNCERLNIINIM